MKRRRFTAAAVLEQIFNDSDSESDDIDLGNGFVESAPAFHQDSDSISDISEDSSEDDQSDNVVSQTRQNEYSTNLEYNSPDLGYNSPDLGPSTSTPSPHTNGYRPTSGHLVSDRSSSKDSQNSVQSESILSALYLPLTLLCSVGLVCRRVRRHTENVIRRGRHSPREFMRKHITYCVPGEKTGKLWYFMHFLSIIT